MVESEKDDAHASPVNPQAVGSLRRLKETETLGQKRLDEARARGETKIKYAQAARDRSVAEARQQAETARVQRLQESRRQAEAEAQRILEAARTEASRWGPLSSSEIDTRMDQVLSAVLGDLRSPAGSAKASGKSGGR